MTFKLKDERSWLLQDCYSEDMLWGGVTTDSHSGYFHFVHDSKRNSVITGRLGNQTAYVEMQEKMVRPTVTCVTG